MGRGHGDLHLPSASPALQLWPSYASLSSPTLDTPFNTSLAGPAPHTPRYGLNASSDILPTEPGAASALPLVSPPLLEMGEPGMNSVVGGALAPTPSTPPSRPSLRAGPDLRLPSFDALGIAAPHPDRYGVNSFDGTLDGAAREALREPYGASHPHSSVLAALDGLDICESRPEGCLGAGDYPMLAKSPPAAMRSPVPHHASTLTPPAECLQLDWRLTKAVQSAAVEPHTTDQRSSVARQEQADTATAASAAEPPALVVSHSIESSNDNPRMWIDGAVVTLLSNINTARTHNTSLKIISHALPSPSTLGHIFPFIISRINDSAPVSPASPLTWINVFHAIPGRFNLADLPTSPPSTPGPPIGGDDYFTQKVFDSAVSISDYQDDLSSLPRSPRPIVPPSTIDVSIVERYIPPSTAHEFAEMFNPNGPSILVDRLVELSPDNGSLIFIYPTKLGAQTFMRDYLSPIIDPILRTMVVVHGLSSDLSRTLGSMSAIDQLPDHETLHRRMATLCARLTQRNTAAQRFHGRRPVFAVSYASKELVKPTRESWSADWWTKQEKHRVREAVKKYSQEAQGRRTNEFVERSASTTELLQELLKGVCEKPYPNGQEPERGIEVSVFVIKRSE